MSPVPNNTINEENIALLVQTFYKEVLQDPVLAPYFIEKLGVDFKSPLWQEHLSLLTDFWKFVVLGYEDYAGNPLQPHLHIDNLSRDAFSAWLTLFHKTVDSLYIPSRGEYFKQKSINIAENFIRKLNL